MIFVSSSLRIYTGISFIKFPPAGLHFLGIFGKYWNHCQLHIYPLKNEFSKQDINSQLSDKVYCFKIKGNKAIQPKDDKDIADGTPTSQG